MSIEVVPDGDDTGKGSHVSVYCRLLKGSCDASLTWPFQGHVSFTLLNQLADENHHTRRVSCSATVSGSRWGEDQFISHRNIRYYNLEEHVQYLRNDILYFRVAVKVEKFKSWLVCTTTDE